MILVNKNSISFLLLFFFTFVTSMSSSLYSVPPSNAEIRVAFLGNSIIYFNDCPRLLEHMLQSRYSSVVQDSCLRGGASLPSLWKDGNGMRNKFGGSEQAKREDGSLDFGAATVQDLLAPNKNWNFVVMNDYTQAPARPENRLASIEALEQFYGPLLQSNTPILLQTAAYRRPTMGSDDLGTVPEFTAKLKEGYELYATTLKQFSPDAKVAPVGDAFLHVHDTATELWNKLFYIDDFHPSPHGTWLEACVLYCTMTGEAPPTFQSQWFETARYMQPNEHTCPLPSAEDAESLRQIASTVCGVTS
jgi:lysophospholipase L1-like esterase